MQVFSPYLSLEFVKKKKKSSFMHWFDFSDSVFVFILEGEKRKRSFSVQFVSGYVPSPSISLSQCSIIRTESRDITVKPPALTDLPSSQDRTEKKHNMKNDTEQNRIKTKINRSLFPTHKRPILK